jgi:signal transduction histidine kinase/CheY-like chemotaxis protein
VPTTDSAAGGHRRAEALARRVALLYAVLAAVWISASDAVLAAVGGSTARFHAVQTGKGLGFVAVTAALLYLLVRDGARRLQRTEYELAAYGARVDASMAQALREQLPIVVWTTDLDVRFTAVTGSLARRFLPQAELDALVGKPIERWFGADTPDAQPFRATREALAGREATYTRPLGDIRVEARVAPLRDPSGAIVGTVGIALDVTERERLEEQLRQAAKLEAVGRLAGGVAHDFNNLLTAILGFVGFALRSLGSHPARADLEQAERAAQRAAQLTQQLLTFSRRERTQPEPIDVDAAIAALLPLLRRVAGDGIAVEHVGQGPCWAAMHAVSLEQVVVNLVANARDAQPHGGTIRIETCPAGDAADGWTTVAVHDEGTGIPEDVRARLFEPFFTTKPAGRGTGLGLATSRAAVEEVGGRIDVESAPGSGATFTLSLPAAAPRRPAAATPVARPHGRAALSVLLVEDEEPLSELFVRWLGELGHEVTAAAGVDEALALLETDEPFDLLLTDVSLPDGDGADVAAAAVAARPGLPVLLMSGCAVEGRDLVGDLMVLTKPFGKDELARAVAAAAG